MGTSTSSDTRFIRLGERERSMLTALGTAQLSWDPRLLVRIVTTPTAVGFYTTPPLDVLTFVAVPAVVEEPTDTVVLMSSLLAMVQSNTDGFSPAELTPMTAPVTAGPSLMHLPPSDGWQMPIHAVASDIFPLVDEAVAEFQKRANGAPQLLQEQIAEEIWSRTAWAGLPMRSLHAAVRLRLMGREPQRVSACTSGPWKRLSTPRGQVFTYATGQQARFGLYSVS